MANPKVFSLFKTKNYAECFPNISVLGKKVDFFLECSSYDVILPVKVKGDSKLDVFEEAVLKLIAYKTTTSEDMADIFVSMKKLQVTQMLSLRRQKSLS